MSPPPPIRPPVRRRHDAPALGRKAEQDSPPDHALETSLCSKKTFPAPLQSVPGNRHPSIVIAALPRRSFDIESEPWLSLRYRSAAALCSNSTEKSAGLVRAP